MAAYGFPLVIGNLAAWILSLSDRYVLEFFRGAQEVGIYSASYAIGEKSILLLTSLFLLTAGPIGMNVWEKRGKKDSQRFLNKVTRYFLIVCLPAIIGISVLAKPIIDIFTAQEYFGGYRILPLIAFSIFFLGLSQRFGMGLTFYKKTIYSMWVLIIGGGVNLGLNFVFIPKYGYFGVAITTLIGYIIILLLMIYFSRKFFVWPFPFKTLGKCSTASLIMGVGAYLLVNNLHFSTFVNLILGILAGIIIYSICIFLFKEVLPEEKEMLKQLAQRYVFKKSN
ncbi:polysaccharide biosynthesis C-terminal domain-containing protein [bacterium]|nr:polysaccharide biosynthesis C-terminal domain-containing protein [bacterium]